MSPIRPTGRGVLAALTFQALILCGALQAQVIAMEGETSPFLNDSFATANDLCNIGNYFRAQGSYISGDPNSDKDFYKFNGDAGATLDIDMTITMSVTSSPSQPYQEILFLFDSSQRMIAGWRNTSTYAGLVSIGIETFTLPATDTYTIGIAEWSVAPTAMSQPGLVWTPLSTRGYSVTGTTPAATFNTAGTAQIQGTTYDLTVNVSSGNEPNSPMCAITSPAPGSMHSDTVSVFVDVDDPQMDLVDVIFSFSTDSGVTWTPCYPAPGSPLFNPTLGATTPATGQEFWWCSPADMIGLVAPQAADIQVTVDDGTYSSTCTVTGLMVDNVIPPPTCTAQTPVSPTGGDITIDLDLQSPSAPAVNVVVEFSIDGGATYAPALEAASSPIPGTAFGVPTGPATFVWDSRGDGVGLGAIETGVIFRATVDDLTAYLQGTCTTAGFDVDNTALCGGICGDCDLNSVGSDIVDALTAAQISAGLVTPSMLQLGCCDVNSSAAVDIVDALYIAQGAAGLPVTISCP